MLKFLEKAITSVRGVVHDLKGQPIPGAQVDFEQVDYIQLCGVVLDLKGKPIPDALVDFVQVYCI